jgi:hypothetical protein
MAEQQYSTVTDQQEHTAKTQTKPKETNHPHTRDLRLKQSTALQQQQQPYPVTPEDDQLGRNM